MNAFENLISKIKSAISPGQYVYDMIQLLNSEDMPEEYADFVGEYLSTYAYRTDLGGLAPTKNLLKLMKSSTSFGNLVNKNVMLVGAVLRVIDDKESRRELIQKALNCLFSNDRVPSDIMPLASSMTREELDYFKIVPDIFACHDYCRHIKDNPDLLFYVLQQMLAKHASEKRNFHINYSAELSFIFSLFPASYLNKLYATFKGTSLARFLLANPYLEDKTIRKALLKQQAKTFVKFRFAVEIQEDELLSLTSTELYSFLKKVFSYLSLYSRREDLIVIMNLPPRNVIEAKLLPVFTKHDCDPKAFFSDYTLYESILSLGRTYFCTCSIFVSRLKTLLAWNHEEDKEKINSLLRPFVSTPENAIFIMRLLSDKYYSASRLYMTQSSIEEESKKIVARLKGISETAFEEIINWR